MLESIKLSFQISTHFIERVRLCGINLLPHAREHCVTINFKELFEELRCQSAISTNMLFGNRDPIAFVIKMVSDIVIETNVMQFVIGNSSG